MPADRITVLGLPLDRVTVGEATGRVAQAIRDAAPLHAVSLNAAKLSLAQRDPELARVVRAAELVWADGIGVVAGAAWLGTPVPERVPGIEVLDGVLACCARSGHRPYLLGAAPGVPTEAACAMARAHPGLHFAGLRDGYFEASEATGVAQEVAASGADLAIIAMGSPRTERFVARHRADLGVPVCMGAGGSLDVWAGRVRRAPPLFRDHGLEWAWRLAHEPRKRLRPALIEPARLALALVREGSPRPATCRRYPPDHGGTEGWEGARRRSR